MIKVEHLVKSFGTKLAVDDVSFTVERGEVLGFLGPNGAGKSTTMRIITGFYPPTSGQVSVGGFDIVESPIPAKRLIGYLPENAPGYADMTVHGFLGFAAELRGLRGSAKKKAIHRAVETCFLESVLYQTIDTYRRATNTARVSRNRSSTIPTSSCSTSRPTDWIPTRNTKCAASSSAWARTKRSCFRRIFSKKWKPRARA